LAPRGGPADYPAHAYVGQTAFAAAAVSADQAKKIFGARIDQAGYVVFEVAVYPEAGSDLTVSLGDFALRLGADGSTMRAAEPGVVAVTTVPDPAFNQPKVPSKVNVSTESTIGYESGTYGRPGGVYAGQGVGVSNYPEPAPPQPNTAAKDHARNQLEQTLSDKQLPTGRITKPVAGYLYFPKPAGHARKDGYQLSWLGDTGQAKMTVPPGQ
jgi:hypothetical protein